MGNHTPLSMLLCDVREHQMTVLRDDGLYRHLRFRRPGTGICGFDLVTWPGHLVITGDLEDFHFARIDDMFEFFRKPVGYINTSYWAEKLCGPIRSKSFSPERFKQLAFEAFWEGRHGRPGPQAPLWRAICEEVLSEAENGEYEARRALETFRYTMLESTAEPAQDFVPQRRRRVAEKFEFTDAWEWDLTEFDWHFQVSCHAIVWGINQYDQHRTAVAPPGPEPAAITVPTTGEVL
jgi:hypothetical protein